MECSVDLTGGKDSRLVLAQLLRSGLAHRVRYQTVGPPDLADVQIAEALARQFGLRHETLRAWPHERMAYADLVPDFVERTGGLSSIWNAGRPRPAHPQLRIGGLPGEMLHSYRKAPTGIATTDDLVVFVKTRLLSPELELVNPSAREQYVNETIEDLHAWDHDLLPADRLHTFFLRHRVRSLAIWLLEETDPDARVQPLYTMAGLRAALLLGEDARTTEMIHRTLIREASPELEIERSRTGFHRYRHASPASEEDRSTPRARTGPQGRVPRRPLDTAAANSRREILGDIIGERETPRGRSSTATRCWTLSPGSTASASSPVNRSTARSPVSSGCPRARSTDRRPRRRADADGRGGATWVVSRMSTRDPASRPLAVEKDLVSPKTGGGTVFGRATRITWATGP